MDIRGKTVLITGGARRIGKAIAFALASEGAHVAINFLTSVADAEKTRAEALATGYNFFFVQADISDPAAVKRMVTETINTLGSVDILINNASRFKQTPFPTDDFSTWKEVTSTLIDGPFYCANAVAPGMLERGGAIINIVDLSAWHPWRHFSAHVVGKAALLALTQQLALEMAPNVRVNAIAPGYVLPPPHFNTEKIEHTASKTLLGHWGKPEDITQAVHFLIKADYITGEVITVDGGARFFAPG